MKTLLVHCSYHKCLTVYYGRVMMWLMNRIFRFSRGYRHFDSRIGDFYTHAHEYRVASINNRALDLERLGDVRVTRFVRDPRDLVVSGYFYHKRGAEPWCNIAGPKTENWEPMNGCVPETMGAQSYSAFLQGLSQEDGLIAEIDFRRKHFEDMLKWPTNDPRIRLFRYEDILGDEVRVFDEIFSFYGLSWPQRKVGRMLAKRFSLKGKGELKSHVRNPKSGQWRNVFTPKVAEYFQERHGPLIERYGYAHYSELAAHASASSEGAG